MNDRRKSICTDSLCPICKGTGWKTYQDAKGCWWSAKCSCGALDAASRKNKLEFATIPKAFEGVRLSNFRTDIYRKAESRNVIGTNLKVVKWWLDNFETMKENGRGLYLYSREKGNGKTRMAASIANELVLEHGVNVKFATSVRIIEEIKASWDEEYEITEHQLMKDFTDADVLVIDDFGIETVKDWIIEKLYRIINSRYIEKKITIFTSNTNLDALEYGDQIINRIKERCYTLAFPNESIRNYIAEQNMNELKLAIERMAI